MADPTAPTNDDECDCGREWATAGIAILCCIGLITLAGASFFFTPLYPDGVVPVITFLVAIVSGFVSGRFALASPSNGGSKK